MHLANRMGHAVIRVSEEYDSPRSHRSFTVSPYDDKRTAAAVAAMRRTFPDEPESRLALAYYAALSAAADAR